MSSSLAVASEGFERDMGGFRLDRLNGDARQAQELHDIRLRVLDGAPENAVKPKRGFVNRHRRRHALGLAVEPSSGRRLRALRRGWRQSRTRRRQSRVAAEIVVKVLVSLQARARNRRDTLLERLQPLLERLPSLKASKFIFERSENRVCLGGSAVRSQLRRQLDHAAVPILEHGGLGFHLY